jgi:hypothetical protein
MSQSNKKRLTLLQRKAKRLSKHRPEDVANELAELLYAIFMEGQNMKERRQWQDKISQ